MALPPKPSVITYAGTPPEVGQSKADFNTNSAYHVSYVATSLTPVINQTNDYMEAAIDASAAAQGAVNYKGDWTVSTNVLQGESYSYNGSTWIAKQNSLGQTPAEGVYWLKGVGTAAYADLGTGASEVPTNADVDNRVSGIESDVDLLEFQSNKSVTIDFASDANVTLTTSQNKYGRIELTDTLGLLTTNREIIVDTSERFILIVNITQHDLMVKTTAGTGFTVQSGRSAGLRCDGINILTSTNCTEMIVPVGNYSSGTYIYPDGHTQTDYETLEFFGGVSIDDSRTSTTLDQEYINNSANTWTVEIPMSTSDSTINTRISHTSLNSFEIIGTAGGGRLKYVIGKLKEGVTS